MLCAKPLVALLEDGKVGELRGESERQGKRRTLVCLDTLICVHPVNCVLEFKYQLSKNIYDYRIKQEKYCAHYAAIIFT